MGIGEIGVQAAARGGERLELAQEAGQLGSWEWDVATGHVHWSATLQRLHGMEPGTFPGTFAAVLAEVYEEDRDRVAKTIERSLESGAHEVEYRIRQPGGGLMWVAGRGRVEYGLDGRPATVRGVCFDITERKRAEIAFQLLADLGNALAQSLHLSDSVNAMLDTCVPRFADWCAFGLSEAPFPRSLSFIARHRDARLTPVVESLRGRAAERRSSLLDALGGRRTVFIPAVSRDMLAARMSSGELAALETIGCASVVIAPLAARGMTIGAVAFARGPEAPRFDDADRQLAEHIASRSALSFDNARLFEEAERSREEALRASAAKDEFLDMVSHEMRTPLMIIHNGAHLLGPRGRELGEHERAAVAHDIERESERLQDMVENLLLLARAEVREPFDAEPCLLIRQVQTLLREEGTALGGANVEVAGGEDVAVLADPRSLDRVLWNLLSNAAKYAGRDGPIEVTAGTDGPCGFVRIADHGPGVREDELPRIFERFWRSPATAKTTSGSGVGLAVCRRLVAMMGGEVRARNREGGGLEVEVRLPRLAAG